MTIFLSVALFVVTLSTGPITPADPPNPVLAFLGQEYLQVGGKRMTRYTYDIANKDAYPAELFAAAPSLPPSAQTRTRRERGSISTIRAASVCMGSAR